MSLPEIIFGTGLFGIYEGSNFDTAEMAQATVDILRNYGTTRIDTARRYPSQNSGTSEQVLGQADLQDLIIDTKVWSMPGCHTPAELQKSVNESLRALNLSKVNILYLHMPDPDTPLQDVCNGMNDIYLQGKLARFGISNITITQIKQMLEICEAKHYIKPTVYQGAYNALARNAESELLPLLRKTALASPLTGRLREEHSIAARLEW